MVAADIFRTNRDSLITCGHEVSTLFLFDMSILNNNEMFAGYKVLECVSSHNLGNRYVYKAVDVEGEAVALIVYNLATYKYYQEDGSFREDPREAVEEIRIYSSLNNNNIPKMKASGFAVKGAGLRLAWMATEWKEGVSLADLVKSHGCLSVKDTVKIMNEILTGVSAIAQATRGGGHYNLNPENILIDYEDENVKGVYLVGTFHMTNPIMGKPEFELKSLNRAYLAPENFKGIFNSVSDIYSLGLLYAYMLIGSLPWKIEVDENLDNKDFCARLKKARTDDSILKQHLSKAHFLIVKRTLSNDPQTRIQTLMKLRTLIEVATAGNLKIMTSSETTSDAEGELKECHPSIWPNRIEPFGGERLAERMRHEQGTRNQETSIKQSGGSLDEVAGLTQVKTVLRRSFIDIVRNPEMAQAYGINPPNGILLYGVPGCGKTFIAEKAAQESGLNYQYINPSDMGSIYVHGAQRKIAETFAEAQKNAPIILIFDEFDALAPKRTADNGNNQANEVNELLTQINNCAERGIYVMGLTNRPDMLDPAILRKGRIDQKFYISLPDDEARTELFRLELRNRPCDVDIDIDALSHATKGYTCSDISFIVKEAARNCFDESLKLNSTTPIAISQAMLLSTISATTPSVNWEELQNYDRLRDKMENKMQSQRARVGFSLNG